jgi:hypothetical protein
MTNSKRESTPQAAAEAPATIYGAIKEGVHIAGFSLERAFVHLETLLDGDGWQQVGGGFTDVNTFLDGIRLDEFRVITEDRKRIAKRIKELQPKASNRAIGRMLGVDNTTINADVGGNPPVAKHKGQQDQRDAAEDPAPPIGSPKYLTDLVGHLIEVGPRTDVPQLDLKQALAERQLYGRGIAVLQRRRDAIDAQIPREEGLQPPAPQVPPPGGHEKTQEESSATHALDSPQTLPPIEGWSNFDAELERIVAALPHLDLDAEELRRDSRLKPSIRQNLEHLGGGFKQLCEEIDAPDRTAESDGADDLQQEHAPQLPPPGGHEQTQGWSDFIDAQQRLVDEDLSRLDVKELCKTPKLKRFVRELLGHCSAAFKQLCEEIDALERSGEERARLKIEVEE